MLKKRVVLWWMLISGIICHVLFMMNINVAIISMVKQAKNNGTSVWDREQSKFEWNETQQNLILGAFYWFAWAAELCGGILSHKYGSKITFGLSNFIGCVLSSVIPLVANVSWRMVVAVRVIQGTVGSVGLPAGVATIIGHWAPPNERGKFSSAFLGITLGTATAFMFFGFISQHLGWEYVFHITAAIGSVWYVFWYFCVHDTPDQHPGISDAERSYIKKSLAGSATKEKLPIPWREILTSGPLLISIICMFGQSWGFLAISIYLPKYMKEIHNMDSTKTGVITGIAFFVKSALQMVAGVVTDSMIKRGMARTRVRNIATLIGGVIPGFLLIGVLLTKYDTFWSVALLVMFISMSSFSNVGATVAVIDMSPNFCGVIQGIGYSIVAMTGFFCGLVVDVLSRYCNDKLEMWGFYFLIVGLMCAIPGIWFMLFSNSEVQPWNNPKTPRDEGMQELKSVEKLDK